MLIVATSWRKQAGLSTIVSTGRRQQCERLPSSRSGSGWPGQRAEQLHRSADGAPVAIAGAHLETDRSLAGIGLGIKAIQPADGIADGLLDRVIETVEVGMGLEERVNQPVSPGRRLGRQKQMSI